MNVQELTNTPTDSIERMLLRQIAMLRQRLEECQHRNGEYVNLEIGLLQYSLKERQRRLERLQKLLR
jgi:hypothetical protein